VDESATLIAYITTHASPLSLYVLFFGGLFLSLTPSGLQLSANWERNISRMRKRPLLPGDAELLLILLLLPNLLGGITYLLHWGAPRPVVSGPQLISGAFMLQFFIACGILLVAMRHPSDRRELFGLSAKQRPGHSMLEGLILMVRGYPYLLLLAAVVMLLNNFGLPTPPQDAVRALNTTETPTWVRIALMGVAVVTAPILEEIVFRGILLPACFKRQSPWVAILLTSILFALAHLTLSSLLPLIGVGILLSLAYLRTGSIIVPITMHMAYNAFQILIIMQLPKGT
jgi:membrane protease YdiL (CAAX protease family)